MTGDGRRRNIIHQSLTRPILLAGAERPLAISNWIIAAALILGAGQWFTVIAGIALATGGHWLLVELAKIDPQLSQIYRRHLRHRQDYYPARASIWAKPPARVRPTVPAPKQMRT